MSLAEYLPDVYQTFVPGFFTPLDRSEKNKGGIFMRESKFKEYSDLPLALTAPEVGEVLGISRAAAYALVRSDGFPHLRIGNRILVPKDKFIAWIDKQSTSTEHTL